jgi:hypothetical protein
MAFFDRLVGDPRMREVQRERARGEGTMASQNYAQQRSANAGVAGATAARLADRGAANPALAGRIAAGQEAQMNAAAGQIFAQQQTAERQRAEAQLADMRAQRQGFFRQMLGAGLRTGSAMMGTYIGGPVGGALGGQVGNAAAGAIGAGPGGAPALPAATAIMGSGGGPPGQGLNAGNFGNAPGGAGDGLGLIRARETPFNPQSGVSVPFLAQPSAAAPAGVPTTDIVDQATGGMSGWVGAPRPAMTDTSGLTDDEYLQLLMSQRGGI